LGSIPSLALAAQSSFWKISRYDDDHQSEVLSSKVFILFLGCGFFEEVSSFNIIICILLCALMMMMIMVIEWEECPNF
jgi:hypothetical protein